MKVFIILACVTTLVVGAPSVVHESNHQHHIRKRPPHLSRPLQKAEEQINHIKKELTHLEQEISELQPEAVRKEKEQIEIQTEPNEIQTEAIEIQTEQNEIQTEQNEVQSEQNEIQTEQNEPVPVPKPMRNEIQKLPALLHEEVHDAFGQYALRFVTAENTVVSERGRLVPSPNGGYVLEIEGKYQFMGDDGQLYVTEYRGGRDGFHVGGKHLPVQVPMPK